MIREAGRLTAALAPTVLVQEGGYHLPTLGPLMIAALTGAAGACGTPPTHRSRQPRQSPALASGYDMNVALMSLRPG